MTLAPDGRDDELGLDDHPLTAIVDAILDGTPTDWSAVDPTRTYDEELAHQLRVLANLGVLDRTPPDESTRLTTPPVAVWGPFQLLEQVGRGAYGDVYRAWDPRLGKEVAVKLLNEPTSGEPEQRNWVIHEARCLAAVRHPNVVTVHGADRVDGRVGFWTEFVHGRTLAAIVAEHGPLGAAEATAIGIDLCRALAAVHRAGLLHRDIKAANVMREDDGRIVLLDFGTSKNVAGHVGVGSRAAASTGTTGTPLYLAPELWRGSAATPQSDLYSVAVVLYFLVTGGYPVSGTTVSELAAAHQAGARTTLADARPDLPAAFMSVLQRALDPNPARRFEDASAFEAALVAAQGATSSASRSYHLLAWAVSALVTLAVVAAVAIAARSQPSVEPPVAGNLVTPDGQLGHPSRDGRFYPWVADQGGDIEVWETATGHSHIVASHDETAGAGVGWSALLMTDRGWAVYQFSATAMSPTGDRVVYTWATGPKEFSLRIVNADGTLGRILLEPRTAYEPVPVDWSADGKQILCWLLNTNGTADLVLIAVDNGKRQLLATKGTSGIPGTTLAPDGRSAIFDRMAESGRYDLVRVSLDDPTPTPIFRTPEEGLSPIWVDPTHLFFARPSGAVKENYDGWIVRGVAGIIRGDPMMVAPNLAAVTNFVVTGHTSIQLTTTKRWPEVYTATLDLTGRRPPTAAVRISPTQLGGHSSPSWSPDGRQIAFFDSVPSEVIGGADEHVLAVLDVKTGKVRELHPRIFVSSLFWPQWTPDAKSLRVYGSDQPGNDVRNGWYSVKVANEAIDPVQLDTRWIVWFLPDGDSSVYFDGRHHRGLVWRQLSTGREEVVVPRLPERPTTRFAVSGDGRYLAYVRQANDHGQRTNALVVQPVRGGVRRTLVTATDPNLIEIACWTPDHQHVLFTRGTGDRQPLLLASLDGGTLVDTHFTVQVESSRVFVHPDGRQIVYGESVQTQALWTRALPLEPVPPKPAVH